jgi:nitrate reductase beta subunit
VLDALLCLLIPVKENSTKASDKKSKNVAQQAPKKGDKQAKKVDAVNEELEGNKDKAELPEEVKKLNKQIPIQMKQYLMVALTQLGEQVMKNPPNPNTNKNSNGRTDL